MSLTSDQMFFQSGVFLWNDEASEGMTKTYRYQGNGFNLFLWVFIPLTFLTLGMWLGVNMRMNGGWTRYQTCRTIQKLDPKRYISVLRYLVEAIFFLYFAN